MIATPEGDQDVTAQQVRLLDSGACGAFVHGLEDEYQDVRNAAISKAHFHLLVISIADVVLKCMTKILTTPFFAI